MHHSRRESNFREERPYQAGVQENKSIRPSPTNLIYPFLYLLDLLRQRAQFRPNSLFHQTKQPTNQTDHPAGNANPVDNEALSLWANSNKMDQSTSTAGTRSKTEKRYGACTSQCHTTVRSDPTRYPDGEGRYYRSLWIRFHSYWNTTNVSYLSINP